MNLTGRKVGQIRIEAQVGNGGMGNVYRGFDEKLERRLAVKVLREEFRLKRQARARFLREARILSRLSHPGICQVYDLVERPEADLLVLEFIEGKTLRELLAPQDQDRQQVSLSFADKLRIAVTVAEVLEAAHREGIVHRDLKPENIMVTPQRKVKILDFGIARQVAPVARIGPDTGNFVEATLEQLPASFADEDTIGERHRGRDVTPPTSAREAGLTFLTQRKTILGTVAYMSPEQAHQRPVTAASDMFTFGLVLQELFTGQRAYPKKPLGALLLQVSHGETRPVRDLGPELTGLIEDLKSPSPARRPTAAGARNRLLALLERPKRNRRRRRRFLQAAVLSVLTLSSLAATLRSRFEVRARTDAARSFGEEVRDIEWHMRALYLGPPQDVRAARARVRRRMADLTSRMEALGRAGRGPGEYALGRAALAMDDLASARRHLEAAWSLGYRPAEVAKALGIVWIELYQNEIAQLGRVFDDDERKRLRGGLDTELRDPALDLLREAGEARCLDSSLPKLTSVDYAAALVAFTEQRYDDALRRLDASAAQAATFYEAHALAGRIRRALGEDNAGRGDYEAAHEEFRAAQRALRKAAEIGRSEPAPYLELCDLAEVRMNLALYESGGSVQTFFNDGVRACETALVIDPDSVSAMRMLANLHFRQAESDVGDPQPLLERAAFMAREALRRDPEDFSTWKTLGHVLMVEAHHVLYRGHDPRRFVDEALEAYRRAHRLAPAQVQVLNSLGNAHSLAAYHEARRGEDPRPSTLAAIEAYRRAIQLSPGQDYFHTNLALAHEPLASYELARGFDPGPGLEPAHEALGKALEINPNYAGSHRVLARLLTIEARRESRSGRDPRPLLDRAATSARRALELLPGDFFARLALASAWQARGEHELETGGDAAGRGRPVMP